MSRSESLSDMDSFESLDDITERFAKYRRPRLLDLFACAGGAGMGYARAGFEVVGVDKDRHPYPAGELIQYDVMDILANHPMWLATFDAIHASPPCQAEIAITKGTNAKHLRELALEYPSLIGPVRKALDRTGLPYIIECGTGPHIRSDITLCGEMFGLQVIRHRDFEISGWTATQPAHIKHRGRVKGYRHGVNYEGYYYAVYGDGGGKGTPQEWADALGIDWTLDKFELREALPPSYTEFIGTQLIRSLGRG